MFIRIFITIISFSLMIIDIYLMKNSSSISSFNFVITFSPLFLFNAFYPFFIVGKPFTCLFFLCFIILSFCINIKFKFLLKLTKICFSFPSICNSLWSSWDGLFEIFARPAKKYAFFRWRVCSLYPT